jgi:hypothetical protein
MSVIYIDPITDSPAERKTKVFPVVDDDSAELVNVNTTNQTLYASVCSGFAVVGIGTGETEERFTIVRSQKGAAKAIIL